MECDIVLRVDIDADAEAVYRAIATTEGQRSFWTPDADLEEKVGGTARFGFGPDHGDLRFTIDQLDEGKRVAWTCDQGFPHWDGSKVTWEIQPGLEGQGVRVLFRQSGWDGDYPDEDFAGVSWTWALVLLHLKMFAESGKPKPALG